MVSDGEMQWWTAPGSPGEPSEQFDHPDQLAQGDPQMAQDDAEVVTAAAQDREDGVAGRSVQRASGVHANAQNECAPG